MNNPATFLLIRHAAIAAIGKSLPGSLPGVPLDDAGRIQAQRLVDRLRGTDLKAIYSSPLERALETAEPLALSKGLPVHSEVAFSEIQLGDWQGSDFLKLADDPLWRRFNQYRSATRIPGGEMMIETQCRAVAALCDAAPKHRGETVAVISHADVIKAALMYFLAIPLDFHSRLDILPASVSILEMFEDTCRVTGINIMGALT